MNRRDFLTLAGAIPAIGLAPEAILAANTHNGYRPQRLVLVRLKGGNDGLNTLIPLRDYASYRALRPQISMQNQHHKFRNFALHNSGMCMNPYMAKLMPWWNRRNMAWIQGVGYPHPVLSHFESSDIWDTGDPRGRTSRGWLSHVMPRYKRDLHGISLIRDTLGGLSGKECHAISMQSPKVFLSQMKLLDNIKPGRPTNPTMAHLTNIQSQVINASQQLENKMSQPKRIGVPFANSTLGRQLESVASMIINGVDAPVFLTELDGFDTHANQLTVQNKLLSELSDGLDSFARTMQHHGQWNNVLVMTYSEFGRRVAENHGGGTDHGAASVQLVMGGRVRGGMYGKSPRLDKLDKQGNLPMAVDFRTVYNTVAQRWFRQPSPWRHLGTLPFV